MMTRSKKRPSTPATSIAPSMAGRSAARLAPPTFISDAATYAPTAMKSPCAKFITSMRPNTSVSPEAMMKMSRPIASPAIVSVTHVDGLRTSASAASAMAARMSSGMKSNRVDFTGAPRAGSLVSLQAQAEQPALQRRVGGEGGHAAGMHDAPRVHHRDRVAKRAGGMEVLLHHEDRGGLLELGEGRDQVVDDRRCKAL